MAAPAAKPMTNAKGTAVAVATEDRPVEYVPFGAKDLIRLTISMVKNHLVTKTKKVFLPSASQCMKFMMLCKARALDPWVGDAYLVGYDSEKDGPTFSLITAHQAFVKRAEVHPEFNGMESGIIFLSSKTSKKVEEREGDFFMEGEVLLGGWARVHFKNRQHPMYRRLALRAYFKDNKFWQRDPAGQICKCAEVHALRDSFPTTLGGMFLEQDWGEAGPAERSQMAEATRERLAALGEKLSDEPIGDVQAPEPDPQEEAPRQEIPKQDPPKEQAADKPKDPPPPDPKPEAPQAPQGTDLTADTKAKIDSLFKK